VSNLERLVESVPEDASRLDPQGYEGACCLESLVNREFHSALCLEELTMKPHNI